MGLVAWEGLQLLTIWARSPDVRLTRGKVWDGRGQSWKWSLTGSVTFLKMLATARVTVHSGRDVVSRRRTG